MTQKKTHYEHYLFLTFQIVRKLNVIHKKKMFGATQQ